MFNGIRKSHPYFFMVVAQQFTSPRRLAALPVLLIGMSIFALSYLFFLPMAVLAILGSHIINSAASMSGDANLKQISDRFRVGMS